MRYIGTKKLETERLILRKLTVKDAYQAFEIGVTTIKLISMYYGKNMKM